MLKLLLAGPRKFTDRVQYEAENYTNINVVSVTTDPSQTIETLETMAGDIDAVLLGFPDDEIELMADVIARHKIKTTKFISVKKPAEVYRKWTKLQLKMAIHGRELLTIERYFSGNDNLTQNNSNQSIYPVESEDVTNDSREKIDIETRVSKVRKRERLINKTVPVRQKVIVNFGQKGGIGKTVISVSLAKSLAALTDLEIVVIDLDTKRTHGDVIRYFGKIGTEKDEVILNNTLDKCIPQERTVAAWTQFPLSMKGDQMLVKTCLVHERENLYYLPPMRYFGEKDNIGYDLVKKCLTVLRHHFDVVIVDGGDSLSDAVQAAMEFADEIFIISTPEKGVLDSLADFTVNAVNIINATHQAIKVIINKTPANPAKLNKELPFITGGFPTIAKFPHDQNLYKRVAEDLSVPHLGEEQTPFLREMEKLICHVFPRQLFNFKYPPQEQKRNLFSRMFEIFQTKRL